MRRTPPRVLFGGQAAFVIVSVGGVEIGCGVGLDGAEGLGFRLLVFRFLRFEATFGSGNWNEPIVGWIPGRAVWTSGSDASTLDSIVVTRKGDGVFVGKPVTDGVQPRAFLARLGFGAGGDNWPVKDADARGLVFN